tara:strand:+ start:38 stop:505 length:468 start_codon:yes stop_codon:yes gene_type:complete
MNNTNSTLYDDYHDDGVFYEVLQDILWLWAILFCIYIPCLYEDDNISPLAKPFHFWCGIIIYILSYIYNFYVNIKKFICNIIIYFTPISIPQANIMYDISSENIPQNITIIYNNSIIVHTPTNDSHASVINTGKVVIAEPINITEEIFLPHVTIV